MVVVRINVMMHHRLASTSLACCMQSAKHLMPDTQPSRHMTFPNVLHRIFVPEQRLGLAVRSTTAWQTVTDLLRVTSVWKGGHGGVASPTCPRNSAAPKWELQSVQDLSLL